MTQFQIALEARDAFEPTFDAACREADHARAAYKRSRSQTNIARLIAAQDAFEVALAEINRLNDAMETAEVLDQVAEAQASKAAEIAAQPSFNF